MDTLFFWISKLAWLLVAPDNLLLIMFLGGLLLFWKGATRAAFRVLAFTGLLLCLVAIFPLGSWLMIPLELRFETNPALPDRVDGIIVLGGAEWAEGAAYWKQAEVNDSAERLLATLSLAQRYPDAKLVYTGGSGSVLQQQFKGAEVAETVFENQGLDLSRVVLERESRNTYENAVLSYRKVKPQSGETWILVTTAWHMPRSQGVFCKAGWATIPYPVDHWTNPDTALRPNVYLASHLRVLRYATHEWLGLAAYYLSGKTDALLPQDCR